MQFLKYIYLCFIILLRKWFQITLNILLLFLYFCETVIGFATTNED